MLARSADSLYWMARYVERAENVARLMDTQFRRLLDLPPGRPEPWKQVVAVTGDLLHFLERCDSTSRETVTDFLAFDEGNRNSIASCLRFARENARALRDVISDPLWEHLNTVWLDFGDASSRARALEAPSDVFGEIRAAGRLFEILCEDMMLHGEAWHFCRLGRFIERADKITRVLDLCHHETADESVLDCAGAFELYRKRHGRVRREDVVDFLLLDPDFPRSARFCLVEAEESLHALTGTPSGTFRHSAEQRLGQLRAELAFATGEDIVADGLHAYLDAFQLKLNLAGDALAERFFAAEAVA